MSVIDFHPPISEFKAFPNPDDPEGYLLNIAACIRLAKDADTPAGRRLYRDYVAAYHGLNGQPLSHEAKEETAFRAAAIKNGWKFDHQSS